MAAIINVRNAVFAEMTDEEAKPYGTPTAIAPLMSIKVDTKTSSEILYGDGMSQETAVVTAETNIEIQVNELPMEVHATMLGHVLDPVTGVMIEDESDLAPYLALGFEIEKSNGSSTMYWYLKGRFEEPAVDAKQKEDKVSFSTPTLKGTFVFRADGVKRYKYDEDAATTPITNFLAEVYKPA